jgi:cell shape-determining protein MreD
MVLSMSITPPFVMAKCPDAFIQMAKLTIMYIICPIESSLQKIDFSIRMNSQRLLFMCHKPVVPTLTLTVVALTLLKLALQLSRCRHNHGNWVPLMVVILNTGLERISRFTSQKVLAPGWFILHLLYHHYCMHIIMSEWGKMCLSHTISHITAVNIHMYLQ